MSAASTAVVSASTIDWTVVAGAAATFIATLLLTWQGMRRGKKKFESGESEITPIVGASIMETSSINQLSDQLQEATRAIRENTAEVRRNTDIHIMTYRK